MTSDEIGVAKYEFLRTLGNQRYEYDRHGVQHVHQRDVKEVNARGLLAQSARVGEEGAQYEEIPEEGDQKEDSLDCCDVGRGISHQVEDGPYERLRDGVTAQFARPAVEEFEFWGCCGIVIEQSS